MSPLQKIFSLFIINSQDISCYSSKYFRIINKYQEN